MRKTVVSPGEVEVKRSSSEAAPEVKRRSAVLIPLRLSKLDRLL